MLVLLGSLPICWWHTVYYLCLLAVWLWASHQTSLSLRGHRSAQTMRMGFLISFHRERQQTDWAQDERAGLYTFLPPPLPHPSTPRGEGSLLSMMNHPTQLCSFTWKEGHETQIAVLPRDSLERHRSQHSVEGLPEPEWVVKMKSTANKVLSGASGERASIQQAQVLIVFEQQEEKSHLVL